MTQPMWIDPDEDTVVGSATIDAGTDVFTLVAHGLGNGERIVVTNLSGGAVGVLAEGGVYWVRDAETNLDEFAIALTRRGLPIDFSVNGGADVNRFEPGYDARELRRMFSGLLWPATTDRLGAREGFLAAREPLVTLSGSDWTVHDNVFVVYPGLTTTSGPYVVYVLEEGATLVSADGTNDRFDAIDVQVQDNNEDLSGFRRARLVPVTGSPGAGEPALTANSFRAVLFEVPAGGSPVPSISRLGLQTVTRGGALPVQDDTDLPVATDFPDGLLARHLTDLSLITTEGGAWETLANTQGYQFGGRQIHTTNGSFSKGSFPGLRAIDVTVIAGGGGAGGCAATSAGEASEAGGGQGGSGAKKFLTANLLGTTETITVGAGGTGGSAGANDGSAGGTSSFTVNGGTNISCPGGAGGVGGSASSTSAAASGGSNNVLPTGGDLNVLGDVGGNGIIRGGESVRANYGGGAAFGFGPQESGAASTGTGGSGKQFGGGASGPRNNDSQTATAGLDAADGVVVIDLYY